MKLKREFTFSKLFLLQLFRVTTIPGLPYILKLIILLLYDSRENVRRGVRGYFGHFFVLFFY